MNKQWKLTLATAVVCLTTLAVPFAETGLRGPDEVWDVALLKFIYEYTAASLSANVGELEGRGLLRTDPNVTRKRPVFFEYTLLEGVNDGPGDARRLPGFAKRSRGRHHRYRALSRRTYSRVAARYGLHRYSCQEGGLIPRQVPLADARNTGT